jgi:hypothetical protein
LLCCASLQARCDRLAVGHRDLCRLMRHIRVTARKHWRRTRAGGSRAQSGACGRRCRRVAGRGPRWTPQTSGNSSYPDMLRHSLCGCARGPSRWVICPHVGASALSQDDVQIISGVRLLPGESAQDDDVSFATPQSGVRVVTDFVALHHYGTLSVFKGGSWRHLRSVAWRGGRQPSTTLCSPQAIPGHVYADLTLVRWGQAFITAVRRLGRARVAGARRGASRAAAPSRW